MPTQRYTTTIEHDSEPLAVVIQSLPRDYTLANHLLTPLHVAQHLGQSDIANSLFYETRGPEVDDALAGLIYLLITAPEVLTSQQFFGWGDANSPQQLGRLAIRREQDQLTEFARYVVQSPVVLTEESWPTPKALAQIAGVGGGTGLGVLIAVGALPPLALLTVPAGIIAIGVAWRARRRLGDLIDPVSRKIRELHKLLAEGAINQAQYDNAVKKLLDQFALPSEPLAP